MALSSSQQATAENYFQQARSHDYCSPGFQGVRNDVEAFRCYREAANLGHAGAQCNLAVLIEAGRGTDQKGLAAALPLYQLSAAQGHPTGCQNMASIYEYGEGGLAKDEKLALQYWMRAAQGVLASAKARMFKIHALGMLGVRPNQAEAFKWLKEAAQADDVKSQVELGVALLKGEGYDLLKPNEGQGVYWLERAAAQDDRDAQRHLANYRSPDTNEVRIDIGTEMTVF